MRRLGVGYRQPLAQWIAGMPERVNCLEITADHFFDDTEPLQDLAARFDLLVHGLGMSLGTPGPLEQAYLHQFREICRIAEPLWVSEHIAFTRTNEVDLGHLNPVLYSEQTLALFVDHVLEVKEFCGKPLLLENITTHIAAQSPMSETDFINKLCDSAGCYLLLDVTNLFVNSRNHDYSPVQWLREINPGYIKQLHIVGYHQQDGKYYDSHANDIQQELLTLTQQVIDYSHVDTVIIERDQNFPEVSQIARELTALEQCFEYH